jgi:hypothetical protein
MALQLLGAFLLATANMPGMVLLGDINIRAWGVVDWIIAIIVIAACIGILYVALRVFGVTLPDWFIKICLIVVVAVVAIAAIRLVASM